VFLFFGFLFLFPTVWFNVRVVHAFKGQVQEKWLLSLPPRAAMLHVLRHNKCRALGQVLRAVKHLTRRVNTRARRGGGILQS